ncbi:MAG: MMPL family transporter, partial [Eubacterium sp.]|nr:MMPL family transporter [Eubacterium sp.]
MNKVAGFLVNKRIWLLTIFLLMAVGSVFLMMKININTDMALYLPDDSRMKQGKDLMTEQLPDTAKQQSQMRVMFDGLSDEEKVKMKDRLAGIAGVASVTWVPDSVDYNKDGHTLYVLKSDAEYGSDTFEGISEALERDYAGNYKVYWHDDNLNNNALTPGILLGALGILLLVLLAMSNSWLEPFIFLFSVGVAVVINMGTNAFLPNVSQMTNSIAALMQLVLSMDYAIILSNRYRQAAKLTEDHAAAMKEAIRQAIPSMCSSAVTTIVGLLALCFMSFKIGADMGIVFAKGVFLSLLGCFT